MSCVVYRVYVGEVEGDESAGNSHPQRGSESQLPSVRDGPDGRQKQSGDGRDMKVLITLSKTNTGRIQLGYVRSTNERGGIGTGSSLPPFNPNAGSEVEEILRNLGIQEDVIQENMTRLRQVGPSELVNVADIEVPDDVLIQNGFAA